MSALTTYLITGASRGLGLALTAALLQDSSNLVIATCRNPDKATKLGELTSSAKGNLHIVKLDLGDTHSIAGAYDEVASLVGDKGIDVLYNNAGILLANNKPFSMSIDHLREEFETNVVGTAIVSQVFLPLVEKSTRKTIVNVSSSLGSIGIGMDVRYSSYSVTKTALNMLTYKQAKERPDLTVVSYDPGWVKTDLGGDEAPLEIETGTAGTLNVLRSLKHEDSGAFFSYDGSRLPW